MTVDEAVALQEKLAPQVVRQTPEGFSPRVAVGLDVAYATDSDQLAAAAVAVDMSTLDSVEEAVVLGTTDFPYVPGLFAFRELPSLLRAIEQLTVTPDVLVCDGQGLAHPRRFGLACHAGVVTGLPSIGVGKQALGQYDMPGDDRGDWTPLVDDGEVVGRALRTQRRVKPVFVSIGHRMDLDTATDLVLRLSPRYRQPETTRAADQAGRRALAGGVGVQDVAD
ncbi:endonuclease V [Actinocrispum wychmicini]|uniref:Endonuclease V n=1 Tax=Actinocrispum wychmicini TaxID=1213861 RepID=A0A4R2JY33_9PSEU|nr:endonuclease V [Actinocrispum wychmicini]TCO64784.1 endonuclease V [Actinocrispum wychmicini]